MKRLAVFLLAATLSVGLSVPAQAQYHTTPKSAKAQAKADRKAAKKQQKAMKKAAKAQRKAQRKMVKQDKKNTHLPSHY
ncbi:MAG TPA: hypothetical protein VJ999_12185 [Candidatus Sulfotelmatobacter sp.]|nr:hypothetical protein [Candidatus Sulfotelmatobacter sp.]